MSRDDFYTKMAEAAKQYMAEPLDIDTKVRWSCNCSGHCCFGTPVLIYPQDAWALVHAPPEVRAPFGIQTSHDLYRDRPPHGSYFHLHLGDQSQMPVSSIRHRPSADGACPFLVPATKKSYTRRGRVQLTVDGKPKMLCGIHEGRPGICRAYPFGRIIHYGKDGARPGPDLKEGQTLFVNFSEDCRSCYEDFDGEGAEEFTIRQFLEGTGVLAGYELTDRWLRILDKMGGIESPNLRFLLGVLAFDFDAVILKGLGLERSARLTPKQAAEVAAARPPTFDRVLDVVERLVDAVLARDPETLGDGPAAMLGQPCERA